MALVDKAAALVENKGEEAFSEFRKKDSEWLKGETYIFVDDVKGTNIFHPFQPDLEGKNLIFFRDVNGKAFIKEFIELLKTKDSGWVDYMWPKPGETQPSKKWSYIKKARLGEQTVIVGAGIYTD